ncbi:Spore cortex-lytic enzyme [Janibacter hoylei PVAS-1]|uniref:Spore cortex-lytic enzyme n=2 Tax=Janibacter hoylei PVAS-1 TaxID=1210046 RepID=K1EMI1_9MICO|nr:L,D-transpeptidase family protein [Janibacter hoylei]EKA60508.1 Spore cortex-lytic enzyme [Janibacter hoylei PVAS-1]MCT1618821.1 L,D-transpeptidase family protein [Janibacter hoylei]
MGTYEARHAVADVETSPQRRLIMRSSLATAAVATVGAAGLATPASAATRRSLKFGSKGSDVKALQVKLRACGYWHAGSDGLYGTTTEQAVMAVQKVYRLDRDGVVGPATWKVIDRLIRPGAKTKSGNVCEINLEKQTMMFVVGGKVKWVFNTSTGAAGWRTPKGRYTFFRQINGMRNAPLGQLWRPKYFNGGIAIHGAKSIPGYAASHGCARLSNAAINYVWSANLAPIGSKVWVY